MMKLRNQILLFVTLLFSTTLTAQTSYEEYLKQYFALNQSNTEDVDMKSALQDMNQELNLSESDYLIDEYLAGQFKDDYLKTIEFFFKRHVSENELKELITIMQTNEYRQYQEHSIASSTAAYKTLGLICGMISNNDYNVDEVSHMFLDKADKADKAYQQLFSSYYDTIKMGDLASYTVNNLFSSMEEEQKDNKSDVLKKCIEYANTNMKTLMMNYSYGILTEDDLKFGIALGQKPSYHHATNAQKELLSVNEEAMGILLLKSYIEWLLKKGMLIK